MEVLAIIPARGGSKTIPRKNIRLMNDIPLIGYTLAAVRQSRLVTRSVVSTDDQQIARVAGQCHGEVPFIRPVLLATDRATDLPVFLHCLDWLRENEGYEPEVVVHLRPTAPLRRSHHIDEAIEMLLASPEAHSVRSICEAPQHPLKMWIDEGGFLEPFVPISSHGIQDVYNRPRQELPQVFVQNGAVDVVRAPVILSGTMSGDKIKAFRMDPLDSVNIDSQEDWDFAELLLSRRLDRVELDPELANMRDLFRGRTDA